MGSPLLAALAMLFAAAGAPETRAKFELGKQAFESTCARCHGADGDWKDYQHIKSLRGLGKRLTKSEIRERLRVVRLSDGTYTTRGSSFSDRQLDALVEYVARL